MTERLLSSRLVRFVALGFAAAGASGASSPGELANSEINHLRDFVPQVSTDGSYATRFVPHVHCTTPWGTGEILELEIPEFICGIEQKGQAAENDISDQSRCRKSHSAA